MTDFPDDLVDCVATGLENRSLPFDVAVAWEQDGSRAWSESTSTNLMTIAAYVDPAETLRTLLRFETDVADTRIRRSGDDLPKYLSDAQTLREAVAAYLHGAALDPCSDARVSASPSPTLFTGRALWNAANRLASGDVAGFVRWTSAIADEITAAWSSQDRRSAEYLAVAREIARTLAAEVPCPSTAALLGLMRAAREIT